MLTGVHGLEVEDARGINERIHLTTYNIVTCEYIDHGVLRLEDGRYPRMTQTIAVHPNGKIYSAPWIEKLKEDISPEDNVGHQVDLISFEFDVSCFSLYGRAVMPP